MTPEAVIVDKLAEEIADLFERLWATDTELAYDCVQSAARNVLHNFMTGTFPRLVRECVTREIQARKREFMENDDHD